MPPHLGCIINQCGGTDMDGLHQKPLFTILGDRGGFTPECGVVDLLKSRHFLVVNFLAGFSVKNHPFAICVLNICFVILMPIYLDFAVPGNSFSFCCHFSTSKCNRCCIFVLPKPHDLLKGAICFLAHFGRLLSFPQVLPDRCI